MSEPKHCVFIAGGTGYVGQSLIPRLLARGHEVGALVRAGSESKLPRMCAGGGRRAGRERYTHQISPDDTFVQLVGVAHPSPAKAKEFVEIDQRSGIEAIRAAKRAGIAHFIYVKRGASGSRDARLLCGSQRL